MNSPPKIADIIKSKLKERNISVSQMLSNCEINRNLITGMEKENKMPSADKLTKIAQYLELSVEFLTGVTDDPAPSSAKSTTDPLDDDPGFITMKRLYEKADSKNRRRMEKFIIDLFDEDFPEGDNDT